MALKNGSWWDGDTQPIEPQTATETQVTREEIITQYAAVAKAEAHMNALSDEIESKPIFTSADQMNLARGIDQLGHAETNFLKFMRTFWAVLPDSDKK